MAAECVLMGAEAAGPGPARGCPLIDRFLGAATTTMTSGAVVGVAVDGNMTTGEL